LTKCIVVGLNPGTGASVKRFNKWCDEIGISYYSFTNMSSDPKWDFTLKTLDENDKRSLCTILDQYDRIICWGDKVSNYLKKFGYTNFFVMPHPSGLNRKINDTEYVSKKINECKDYIL